MMLQNKSPKKINIGIITWFFPKLSESFILNQIIFLREHGYNISIFAVKNACFDLAKEDIELEQKIHEGVNKWNLMLFTTYGSISKLKKTINLRIQAGKLDLLYFQFSDLAAEMLRDKPFGIPVVTTVHDIPKFSNSRELNRLRKKFASAFLNANIVLAISEFTAQEIIKLGCPKDKIIIHHMAINPKLFRSAPFCRITREVKLLMVGRFVEKKGFEYGIRAVHKIIAFHPKINFHLDIVGDGILRKKLTSLVSKLKLDGNVTFHGKLSQKEISRILRNTHILLCPSITTKNGKREGLPVVLLEAIATGIPIIASNHTAIPELAKNYSAISIVPEKSIRGLSSAIETVILNYKTYKHSMINYRRKAIAEYGISKLGKKLINIFNLAMRLKNQSIIFQSFAKALRYALGQKILSVILIGSLARNENISSYSDIDLIVVFRGNQGIPIKNIDSLRRVFNWLSAELGMNIIPQIFNEFDLFQMVSPVFIRAYIEDGKVIFGHDLTARFHRVYRHLSQLNFDLAIFKRMLFQRELVRQMLVIQKPSLKQAYYIAKNILFFSKDFICLDKSVFSTSRHEIVKLWTKNYQNSLPSQAAKLLNKPQKFKGLNSFIKNGNSFIEIVCDDAYRLLLKKYPHQRIQVNAF